MVKKDMSLSSIERDNPQWMGKSVLSYVRYRRRIFENILRDVIDNRVTLITGPLGVGKTTMVKHLMTQLQEEVGGSNILYLPCDTETVKAREAKNYFFDKIFRGGENLYVFIDEFLMMPNYEEVINELLERDSIHLVLISSSYPPEGLNIDTKYKEYVLNPLSFREFLEFHGYDAPSLGRDSIEVRNFYIEHLDYDRIYEKYLVRGGFPAYGLESDDEEVMRGIREKMELLLYKYIPRMSRRRRPVIADKLMAQICFEPGEAINYNLLSESIEKDIRTVSSYIKTLVNSYMINIVRHMVEGGHEGRKMPKLYPYSPAYPLALHPQRMDEEDFMSRVVESHIVLERGVKKYVRRASGADVLIVESDGREYPVLVTYVRRASRRDVKKVVNTLKKLGGDWGFLVVRETYEFIRYKDMEVWVVPAWLFSLLSLGQ